MATQKKHFQKSSDNISRVHNIRLAYAVNSCIASNDIRKHAFAAPRDLWLNFFRCRVAVCALCMFVVFAAFCPMSLCIHCVHFTCLCSCHVYSITFFSLIRQQHSVSEQFCCGSRNRNFPFILLQLRQIFLNYIKFNTLTEMINGIKWWKSVKLLIQRECVKWKSKQANWIGIEMDSQNYIEMQLLVNEKAFQVENRKIYLNQY